MSNDLTFITNESGFTLSDRFHSLLGRHTQAFDSLVGYFYISGFHRLFPALAETERIRVLIGLKTDRSTVDLLQRAREEQQTFDFLSHAEAKERLPKEILDELDKSDDSEIIEEGIRKFVEWCRSGKLEIKVFPSENIHAKVYIFTFVEGHFDKGRVITGSSNFSQTGLVDNLEFNVELKNRSDYEFALQKFNALWENSVEVSESYIDTIERRSPFARFEPYELFLKFLYEYFKAELNRSEEFEAVYLPSGFKKLKYQDDAVVAARRILDEYGGVFISDVVGLGKTYMSAMLAQQLDGRTLVIAPPALLDKNNPGAWPNVFFDFRVPQTDFQSVGKLDELLRRDLGRYSNIFLDESHRFRTESNETYEKLAQICRGKRVVLVSATPLNNTPSDILSQIKLFQNGKNSTIPNVKNLEAFFAKLEKRLKGLDRQRDREEYVRIIRENAREIREKVLKYLMIRRTRNEISTYYAADLVSQGLKFPEVADPVPVFYEFNEHENQVFTRTLERLTRSFTYARYRPLTYFAGESAESEKVGEQNLARFMKILLVKRLESSFSAFWFTIARFIGSYERFLSEYRNGFVYISKRQSNRIFELLDNDDIEAVERLIETDQAQRFNAAQFSPQFLKDLENDLALLHEVRSDWETVKRDPKWETLRALLGNDPNFTGKKLILFTESKETAEYLASKLRNDLNETVLLYYGGSDRATRERVLQNFDARAFQPRDDHRVLVATDTLSEGVSLHRTNIIINYDIPWNPTRMIQRVGRVNRVDTTFDTVRTYNFFPTEQSNDVLKLTEAAESKIQAFIEMLGADARLLTEGEEIKSHDLFRKLVSRKTITGEDEGEESELEYLKIIRDVRDTRPDLFDRIKHLPKKARSARRVPGGSPSLLTYFRKGKLEKFFAAETGRRHVREVDFLTAVKLLQCAPDTEHPAIGPEFYPLLDLNKKAFVEATTEESESESVAGSGRDNAAKVLRALKSKQVKLFKGFTDEDEEFIKAVMKLLEDGVLPRTKLRKLADALKTQINPLKILGILKRDIPASFFQDTQARQIRHAQSRREVILSMYLKPDSL